MSDLGFHAEDQNSPLFRELFRWLEKDLDILPDKPEEDAVSTLRALWLSAAGTPCGLFRARGTRLPELDPAQEERLRGDIQKRLSSIPLAHLTGLQDFMGMELLASPEALIPRKETEILGRLAVESLKEIEERFDAENKISQDRDQAGSAALVIDVCTGAGNIALAMASAIQNVQVYAADLSVDAVQLAIRNAEKLEVQDHIHFFAGDLFSPFDRDFFWGRVDLVTCNPPYISSKTVKTMADEISKHEPSLAFDGGPFGVGILSALLSGSSKFLKPGGRLCFEVGLGQGPAMMRRLNKKGIYSDITTGLDGAGEIRALRAVYTP